MSNFCGKPWEQWLHEYSQSHQHPINRGCHTLGIPMIAISLPLLFAGLFSSMALSAGLALFFLGWALQFIGHLFERKWPEFFHDWRFLFVGLRWWWAKVRSRL